MDTNTEQKDKGKVHLAAACGTYCGACPAYIAKHGDDDKARPKRQERRPSGPTGEVTSIPDPSWMDGILCDGCLSGGEIPTHCQNCSIKLCAASRPGVTRCSDCEELPCYRITDMIDTGLLHRAEYMTNLGKIRDMSAEAWVEYEEERWRCPRCGLPMRWYDANCTGCGETRSKRVFRLT